jgi:hypothetical protein
MRNGSFEADPRVGRVLQHEMREAGDEKLMRILAVLDGISDPKANQALLDPLRARLASLKPPRPLRFSRLLFIPLDPLIVAAPNWKPGEPLIPRTALAAVSNVVRAGLKSEAIFIDKAIAGRQTDAAKAITIAGEVLWPLAAEILAAAPPPDEWSDTGLKPSLYAPLANAIAAVLRRASHLRDLLLNGDAGPMKADDRAINGILTNIGSEPADGCAMIARLILLQSPHAVALWRQLVSAIQNQGEKAMLQKAMTRGVEQVLTIMENEAGFAGDIGRAPLASVACEVRRINNLLQEIERDSGATLHRGRLRGIRDKLDQACRTRFIDGLDEGLFTPLAVASGSVDAAGQTQLEACTRDLRTLEVAARKVGGSADYDGMLLRASEAVTVAAEAGMLTPMRKYRLIEILCGPDAAASLYRQEMARP